jgi:predicted MFS family arabinose efflux permease
MSVYRSNYLPFMMWLLPISFFAYQFILRLWPGLMMHEIMERFSIDASNFGILVGVYYWGHAGMQIPVAILLERFSARYVICVFALVCGISMWIFSTTTNFNVAYACRFFIGAGSAVGFLGVSKVISLWFPKEHYARMVALSFSIGLLGAIYGGKPTNYLIEIYSGNDVALILSIVSIVIGLSVLTILREAPKNKKVDEEPFNLISLKTILSSKSIWMLAIANLLMVGALEGFADVWGVPYFVKAFDLEKGTSAQMLSLVYVGMLFGGPLLALFSKKMGSYNTITSSGLIMSSIFYLVVFMDKYNPWLMSLLLVFLGILCCYQVLMFVVGSELVQPQHLGITVAFLNCMNMLGGSFFHTGIGKILDILWNGHVDAAGVRVYELQPYQSSLMIIPVCALVGTFMVWKVSRQPILK